jgi:beta-lactamase superfamily II metal-dependent hydrolase
MIGDLVMSKLNVKFLNVGQGDSTFIEYTDSKSKVWRFLIDCNRGTESKGIDVPRFLKDRIPVVEEDGKKVRRLDYLIVTHPHSDHIQDLEAIGDDFVIGELWDSGHVPETDESGEQCELYQKYEEVKEKHGPCKLHKMSRTAEDICDGELQAHVFSPSRFIDDEDEMTGGERREAIHSECMAFKLIFNDFSILFTGDSNWLAWQRITDYEEYDDDTLKADVLHVSHHGSRTFFKKEEEDDPLLAGIERIAPTSLVISVPKKSKHGHPHESAMKIYKEHVAEDEIYFTYNNTVELEVDDQGAYTLDYEDGSIQEEYELSESGSDDDGGKKSTPATSAKTSRIHKSRSHLDDQGAA